MSQKRKNAVLSANSRSPWPGLSNEETTVLLGRHFEIHPAVSSGLALLLGLLGECCQIQSILFRLLLQHLPWPFG